MPSIPSVVGHTELAVSHTDGSKSDARVRQLPLSQMMRYSQVQDDDAAHIELLCDQPAGWGDTVAPESVDAIIAEGDQLNADFFAQWLRRRAARLERIAALMQPASVSTNSAPTSPSAPDSPSPS